MDQRFKYKCENITVLEKEGQIPQRRLFPWLTFQKKRKHNRPFYHKL